VEGLNTGHEAQAFALVKSEIQDTSFGDDKDEHSIYSRELKKRPVPKLGPRDDDAREVLKAIVNRQTARLNLIPAHNEEIAKADAAQAPDRLAFDPSPEGEKLRRYALSAARFVNQIIEMYLSVVCGPLSVGGEDNRGELESGGGGCLERGLEEGAPFAERKATIWNAAENDATFAERRATIRDREEEDATFAERRATIGDAAEDGATFAQPKAAATLRTKPNAISTGTLAASFSPEPAATAPMRTELNGKSFVVRGPLSAAANERQDEAVECAGDSGTRRPNDAAPRTNDRLPPILRTEPTAMSAGIPPASYSREPPPASALAGALTTGVAVNSDPNDASNRRYFGARMAATRAGCAEPRRIGRKSQSRAGSRKATGSRQQN
jgi:hypothetical protein